MVINGYGLLWYFFTLAAGASFMWIYLHIKSLMTYMDLEDDFLEEDYDKAVVTVNNKYYEVPQEVATSITTMNKCAEMLATDLALKKKKEATSLFIEYFNKAKETTKN